MSGVPRDPVFWKRFSMAVHMDEEKGPELDMKHSDSWLARQQRKKTRGSTYICCTFWLSFFIFVAAVIAIIIWLLDTGRLSGIHIGNGNGTPNQPVDPNSDVTKRMVEDAAGMALRWRYRES